MSRIENLANVGLVTKTGLIGNETAEAWTAEEMLANQTITKTGLDPNEVEKEANGPVATPVIAVESDSLTVTCATDGATISVMVDNDPWITYENAIDVSEVSTVLAKATKTDYKDSETAKWEKPAGD